MEGGLADHGASAVAFSILTGAQSPPPPRMPLSAAWPVGNFSAQRLQASGRSIAYLSQGSGRVSPRVEPATPLQSGDCQFMSRSWGPHPRPIVQNARSQTCRPSLVACMVF